jgi:hypothetical protein
MAAEHIEDVKIDLLKLSNSELEARYNFMPSKLSPSETKQFLRKSLDDFVVEELIENPSYQMQMMNELK